MYNVTTSIKADKHPRGGSASAAIAGEDTLIEAGREGGVGRGQGHGHAAWQHGTLSHS